MNDQVMTNERRLCDAVGSSAEESYFSLEPHWIGQPVSCLLLSPAHLPLEDENGVEGR